MRVRVAVFSIVTMLLAVSPCLAADGGHTMDLPVWTTLPFILMLAAIALLPLFGGHFWHANLNKGLVGALLSAPVILTLIAYGPSTEWRSIGALVHELHQYVSFIVLLGALYTVAGGIVLSGDLVPTPRVNALILLVGLLLASVIGTTGASMVLIRPFARINRVRANVRHLPVFFIFLVSNLGGLLTPLGDPPLFLGFLNGVEFFWTLRLWPHWLVANGTVLAIFFVWDILAYRREDAAILAKIPRVGTPLRVGGVINVPILGGVVLSVFLPSVASEFGMIACAGLSLWLTPAGARKANEFSWGAIIEVAVLFLGIFVTMTPALAVLQTHGQALGLTHPWQFFWTSGALSSVLDNAPTYMVFGTLAAGPHDLAWLSVNEPTLLKAVSAGCVFMGANTYIGNGPNFMVKAIAEEGGLETPSFFGYMVYSGLVLLPVFGFITLLFF